MLLVKVGDRKGRKERTFSNDLMWSSVSFMTFLTFCFIPLRALALAWLLFLAALFSSLSAESTSAGSAIRARRN